MPQTVLQISLKEKLDEIDNRICRDALDGLVNAGYRIKLGMWEKGEAISLFRGVNGETSYRQMELSSGRKQEHIKRWHTLYTNHPDRAEYEAIALKEAETWAGKRLPKMLGEPKKERINETAGFPPGKYSVIYADPPWQYNNSGFDESAQSHYPTMDIEQLCALRVGELATRDTVLFLWITNPILPDAFRVIESWGFEYKTNFVWNKNKGPSIGWFNHARHELLLIATAKNNIHPREKFDSCIFADVSEHSKKPEIVYKMIGAMYSEPYIELFARNRHAGWDAWGNEVPEDRQD